MGWIARFIDGLSDAERDLVIQHPDPTYDGEDWWSKDRDCGCLVGCALQNEVWGSGFGRMIPEKVLDLRRDVEFEAGVLFHAAAVRFGPERMWRLVKARAAKANGVVIPAVAEEAALA